MEKPEEKWKDDIEEILAGNSTIDRWIIHDFVWNEEAPVQMPSASTIHKLMLGVTGVFTGRDFVPKPELKETFQNLLSGTGIPGEMIDELFERAYNRDFRNLKPLCREMSEEEFREALGDDD